MTTGAGLPADAGQGTPERFPAIGADAPIAYGQACWAADEDALEAVPVTAVIHVVPDPLGAVREEGVCDLGRVFPLGSLYASEDACKARLRERCAKALEFGRKRLAWLEARWKALGG